MGDTVNSQFKSGESLGMEGEISFLVGMEADAKVRTEGLKKIYYWSNDWLFTSYAWTTTVSEVRIEVEEVSEFTVKVLFHWVIDTPVAAANDHNWPDDMVFVFDLYNPTEAHVMNLSHQLRRGCGRYVYEVPNVLFSSRVAWPLKNTAKVIGGGSHKWRVTAC